MVQNQGETLFWVKLKTLFILGFVLSQNCHFISTVIGMFNRENSRIGFPVATLVSKT